MLSALGEHADAKPTACHPLTIGLNADSVGLPEVFTTTVIALVAKGVNTRITTFRALRATRSHVRIVVFIGVKVFTLGTGILPWLDKHCKLRVHDTSP